MQHLAIEVEYNSHDGCTKKKLVTSNSNNDTIANFARNVRNRFEMKDSVELVFKMELKIENEGPGKF